MAAVVEVALVILAQAVVVLVVGRGEGGANGKEFRIGGSAVVEDFGGAVLLVGLRLLQSVGSDKLLPSGVEKTMCAPGVVPLKYFAMSSTVCGSGVELGRGRSTVATMRLLV